MKPRGRLTSLIAFVGLTPRLEGEEMKVDAKGFAGGDRTDLALPDVQQQLLEAVAKTGKPIVIVLLNGSALAVNWAQQNARALLEAWYPGQSGGQAIAETLSGKNNPAGRLPITFYTGVDQLPAFDDYSMANRTYRYFKGKPLYAFGDGLSYTTFSLFRPPTLRANPSAPAILLRRSRRPQHRLTAGRRSLRTLPHPPAIRPRSQARSCRLPARPSRIPAKPGISPSHLDPRTLSQVDDKGTRAIVPGEYKLSLGSSQPDGDAASTVQSASFTITGTKEFLAESCKRARPPTWSDLQAPEPRFVIPHSLSLLRA